MHEARCQTRMCTPLRRTSLLLDQMIERLRDNNTRQSSVVTYGEIGEGSYLST
jgi:hypothetical protein